MENYWTAFTKTEINRSSWFKSTNCFQCNFVDIGLWNSIYKKFHCWMEQGVFERILHHIGVPKLLSLWDWFDFLQSSSTRKRRKKNSRKSEYQSFTRRKNYQNFRSCQRTFSACRSWVEQWKSPRQMAIKLLSKITLTGKKVLADMAFCSELIREYIFQEKATSCILDKSNAVSRLWQRTL